jgi:hypothetical protein
MISLDKLIALALGFAIVFTLHTCAARAAIIEVEGNKRRGRT